MIQKELEFSVFANNGASLELVENQSTSGFALTTTTTLPTFFEETASVFGPLAVL